MPPENENGKNSSSEAKGRREASGKSGQRFAALP